VRFKLLGLTALFSLLLACSTTEKKTTVDTLSEVPEEQTAPLDAQALFQQALNQPESKQQALFIKAREVAIEQQNWPLVITLCEQLLKADNSEVVGHTLYLALAYTRQQQYQQALNTLVLVDENLSSPKHIFLQQEIYGDIYAAEALPDLASPYLIKASELAEEHNYNADNINQTLWQILNQMSVQQLEQFNTGSSIQRGWVSLALYTQLYIGDTTAMHSALNEWQNKYTNHPANAVLQENKPKMMSLTPISANKIALILPSNKSRQKALSQAVIGGILAASHAHPERELFFIDSASSIEEISLQLSEINPDFVIGPLLKNNIEKLKNANILDNYPAMYLNTTEVLLSSADHFSFALKPEHEVTQAVYHFINQEFKNPLIIAPGNRLGKRLATHFTQQWQQYAEDNPQLGFYATNRDMQKLVQELLEVNQSKARIKQIESIVDAKLHIETRSRSDIDAIYIIADATQARLLKPSFDVNISTFASRIPIYASSRSHDIKEDQSDKKDLAGMYFSEIPWMLPLTGDSQALREQFDLIWPDNSTLEQQLFAMGFDAVQLIPQLRQLKFIPGKALPGLTGSLSVNKSAHIERRLKWAQYKGSRTIAVGVDSSRPMPLFIKNHYMEIIDNKTL
jgi:hypothetical protein